MTNTFGFRSIATMAVAVAALGAARPLSAEELSGFDCLVEPHSVVQVGSRDRGIVSEVLVRRGDTVKRGQILVKLESGVEDIQVELARSRSQMSGSIEGKREALKYLKRQLARIEELYEKKAVPYNEYDQAATDVLLAQKDLQNARENMELAATELKRAEEALSRRVIQSPVDGVVVQRMLQPGEYVEEQPVILLAEAHPLNVEVILPVELMGRIGKGTRAEVVPLYPGGTPREAVVVVVDRVVDAASNTFGVRLELANPDYEIPGGVRCDIRFSAGPESGS